MGMNKWNRNGEGYMDHTAGRAIQKVSREERKKCYGKEKRSEKDDG